MALNTVIIAAACCLSVISAQNSTVPTMPLKYFRDSGLQQAMAKNSSEDYIRLFRTNFELVGITNDLLTIKTDADEKLKIIGGTSIKDLERSSLAQMLPHANCNPYEQVITIPNDKPNVLLYPSCVVLKQCGGCCGHPALTCKPTQTQPKHLQVTKYVYDGQQAHPVERVDYVEVQEHTACQCQCKITEADCDLTRHYFDDWDCKCVCKQQQQSCPVNMRWDENLCACRCSSIQNCGTGYTYNLATCSCEAVNGRSNTGDAQQQPGTSVQEPVQQGDTKVVETATQKDPCTHLRCPRRYSAQSKNGTCKCVFTGRRGRR